MTGAVVYWWQAVICDSESRFWSEILAEDPAQQAGFAYGMTRIASCDHGAC